MGLALLRARYLDADVRQLAVWDGGPAMGEAGTAIDVETWRARRTRDSIDLAVDGRREPTPATRPRRRDRLTHRVVRAMLFADVKGFSKLSDEELPRFAEHVLGAFAEATRALPRLDRASEHMGRRPLRRARRRPRGGRPARSTCRQAIGGARPRAPRPARRTWHCGSAPTSDRSSRPRTRCSARLGVHGLARQPHSADRAGDAPGVVYVTEPFAAALALAGRRELACDYVGHMPAAKDFGRLRMYRLHRGPGRPLAPRPRPPDAT